MIDSSAGNRNLVPPIIHVIDEALGRLLYFPIGYERGLLHSSEVDLGESAVGRELPRYLTERAVALSQKAATPALRHRGSRSQKMG
jgi:hypothetical protein